jgi:DNA polymerase-3 subunit beta
MNKPKTTFSLERTALAQALKTLSAPAKTTQRINLSFGRDWLELAAGQRDFYAELRLAGKGSGEQRISVPAGPMREALGALGGSELKIELDEDLVLHAGERRLSLAVGSPEPAPDSGELAELGKIAVADLQPALERAARCASRDQLRPILNTVAIELESAERAWVLATDSFRLAMIPLEGEFGAELPDNPLLIELAQAKAISADLKRHKDAADLTLGLLGRGPGARIVLSYDECRWVCAAVQGSYPAWRQLVPEAESMRPAQIDSDELAAALKAALALGKGNRPEARTVRLHLAASGGALRYRASESGELDQSLADLHWEGADLEIGFNPEYLADALRVLDSERIEARFMSPERPALLRPGNGEAADHVPAYLLMPVRLAEVVPTPS